MLGCRRGRSGCRRGFCCWRRPAVLTADGCAIIARSGVVIGACLRREGGDYSLGAPEIASQIAQFRQLEEERVFALLVAGGFEGREDGLEGGRNSSQWGTIRTHAEFPLPINLTGGGLINFLF